MGRKRRSSSSSSDECLMTLKKRVYGISNHRHSDAYKRLCENNPEKCEFCDEVLSNKLSLLKHNATHIIIPLIKQHTYECHECSHHFTSQDTLALHTFNKHSTGLPQLKIKDSLTDKLPEILQSMVTKQVFIKCEDELRGLSFENEHEFDGAYSKQIDSFDRFTESDSIPLNRIKRNSSPNSVIDILSTTSRSNSVDSNRSQSRENSPLSEKRGIYSPFSRGSNEKRGKYSPYRKKNRENSTEYTPFSVISRENTPISKKSGENDYFSEKSDFNGENSPLGRAIQSRILFEDDGDDILNNLGDFADDDLLLKTFTDDCQVNLETFGLESSDLDIFDVASSDVNIVSNTPDDDEMRLDDDRSDDDEKRRPGKRRKSGDNEEWKPDDERRKHVMADYGPSIHYDELNDPKLCYCKWCGIEFPNRFILIQHETTHIKIRRSRPKFCGYCDRFIADSFNLQNQCLRKHIYKKHPGKEYKIFPHKTCKRCNLRYFNYTKHLRNYHDIVTCEKCTQEFPTRSEHVCKMHQLNNAQSTNAPLNNAQLTNAPLNNAQLHNVQLNNGQLNNARLNNTQLNYPQLSSDNSIEHSTILPLCELCSTFLKGKPNLHYEVIGEYSKVGTRQTCQKCNNMYFEVKLVKRTYTFSKRQSQINNKKKPLSNSERLKKMQNRLKMIKKRNQC